MPLFPGPTTLQSGVSGCREESGAEEGGGSAAPRGSGYSRGRGPIGEMQHSPDPRITSVSYEVRILKLEASGTVCNE